MFVLKKGCHVGDTFYRLLSTVCFCVFAAVSSQMSGEDVVQAIFQQLERPLDRYLRVTRQKLWYSRDSIMERIDLFVRHDMSSKAFLEPYLKQVLLINWF